MRPYPIDQVAAGVKAPADQGSFDREARLPRHLTPVTPTTYTLELTPACNQSCAGCGSVLSPKRRIMRAEQWRTLLARLRPELLSVRITGGECTLHPDFAEILCAVDHLDVPFAVFTNAVWEKPPEIMQLLARRKNLIGLLVSLHGHDARTHAVFSRARNFDAIIDNVRRVSAAGVRVSTNTVLLRSNVKHLSEIIELSLSLGATSVAFSRYYGGPLPDLELSTPDFQEALQWIAEQQRRDPRVIFNNCVPFCSTDSQMPITKGCTSGFTHCTLDPLGNVRPCTHVPIVLGSIWKQTIAEIWDSERLRDWRQRVPKECIGCAAFGQCRGGCRAMALARNLRADPLMRQPRCTGTLPAIQNVTLARNMRLAPNYALRSHSSGLYLVNCEGYIAVTEKARPILARIEQRVTISEIQQGFGQGGIDFVGRLIRDGLVVPEIG